MPLTDLVTLTSFSLNLGAETSGMWQSLLTILYLLTHTCLHSINTKTLPNKSKTNLMSAGEIGLSPLKGDFLADPLQASLLNQDKNEIPWDNTHSL